MESFVWIGFAAFFVAALAVGIRLLRLWRRTRELPELLIGIGVLGIGPVGFGFATLAEILRSAHPEVARGVFAIALLSIASGAFAKYVFNWRVYHPQRDGVRAGVAVAGLIFVACFVSEALGGGFRDPYSTTVTYYLRSVLQVGCLLWGSAEALVYWGKMRRRLRLGLADPVVTNRFFLWGLGAGAAGVGSVVGIVAQIVTGLSPLQMPWVLLSSSIHGLTAAIAMWLAFLPTARYRRFIESRARARFGA